MKIRVPVFIPNKPIHVQAPIRNLYPPLHRFSIILNSDHPMKIIALPQAGGPEKLIQQEIEKPAIGDQEVLVKVHAIGINPVDIKTRSGKALYGSLEVQQPLILGWDISGEVVSVGKTVGSFKTGDAVFGMVNFPGHGKAYAEYVAAPAEHLALKPANISHQEAAASTLAALTAWQVLYHQANVQVGQRVLIHAAAGGVGHFAVQLAKHLGAYVIGTASASNAAFLQELSVDEHIDYTSTPFEEVLTDVDVVLDPIGGETTLKSLSTLKPGGKIISIVGGVKDEAKAEAEKRGIEASNYLVHSSGEDMETLAQLLQKGKLKAHVSAQFSFQEMAKAHQQIETGRTRGKVVVNGLKD
jgi:NADPH:quinone reductase-like Zn-dependent oxidoreductase